jgi:hypothetical protein
MAKLYFDERNRQPYPGGIRKLPLKPIREKLYDSQKQRLIPFLGAGASLKAKPSPTVAPPAKQPTAAALDQICNECNLTDPASRRFVEVAIQFAQLIAQRQATIDSEDRQYAPSSWELARRLAEMLVLEPLRPAGDTLKSLLREPYDRGDYVDIIKNVADVMGLSRSVPQLLTVASYFNEGQNRGLMCEELLQRFENVSEVTDIQRRIVDVAKTFVDAQNNNSASDKRDYLVITTNYDPLLEVCLAQQNVPTCVMTVDMRSKAVLAYVAPHTKSALGLSEAEFDELRQLYEQDDGGALPPSRPLEATAVAGPGRSLPVSPRRRVAGSFTLGNKSHSLVLVYKIHGCPIIDQRQPQSTPQRADNIVISDQDYVRFIQENGSKNSLIPAYVSSRMLESAFLFLGYSFSDWNVRSLYQNFVRSRYKDDQEKQRDPDETMDRDYIVMRSYDSSDDYFLRQWNVSVLVTDLDTLAENLTPPGR